MAHENLTSPTDHNLNNVQDIPLPQTTRLFQSKILVLDDDEIIVEMIQFSLYSAGFKNSLGFTDSQLAIDNLKTDTPDLIITDLYMPNVGGSFLTRLVRTYEHLKNVPVMVITSEDSSITHQKLHDIGVNMVVTKPFDPASLVTNVRAILGGEIGLRATSTGNEYFEEPPTATISRIRLLEARLKDLS